MEIEVRCNAQIANKVRACFKRDVENETAAQEKEKRVLIVLA